MAKFRIQIIERSSKVVEVEADDLADAFEKVRNSWDKGDIELDTRDFDDMNMEEYNAIP